MTLEPVSDSACLLQLGGQIDSATAEQVQHACDWVREQLGAALIDLVPSYTSVLIELDPLKLSPQQACQRLAGLVTALSTQTRNTQTGQRFEIPVYYADEVAPDLADVCARTGLTQSELISRHSAIDYRVFAIGFAPGFCFLGSLDPLLRLPRRSDPRSQVAAGSVAIAEQQTAVYPLATPGGWHLIGRTAQDMLSLCSDPKHPLRVGDTVRFVPVARDAFVNAGGRLT